ncbi:uncharacterized protein [Diadema antillarum]|uniref:uncharacterized protein n=1 Tax=Diadema antillarum TaxID=105358 RepID=UPI003A8A7436
MGNHPMLQGKKRYICRVPSCPVIHTEDGGTGSRHYVFLRFELSQSSVEVDFELSAAQDAEIALSRENTSLVEMYRIVFGSIGNTHLLVQRECQTKYSSSPHCQSVASAYIPSKVFSGIPTYDHFWLTFDQGRLMIGRHGNQVSIIDWTDPNPLPVNHIGVWTGRSTICLIAFSSKGMPSKPPPLSDLRKWSLTFLVLVWLLDPLPTGLRGDEVASRAEIAAFAGQNHLKLFFGSYGNTNVRVQRECPTKYSSSPKCQSVTSRYIPSKVLSGIPTYDHFWLTFAKGRLRIGRHGNQVPIIDGTDPDPLPVNHIGVWTGWGSEGYWKFHSIC